MHGSLLLSGVVGFASGIITRSFFVIDAVWFFRVVGVVFILSILVFLRGTYRNILWGSVMFASLFASGVVYFEYREQVFDMHLRAIDDLVSQSVVFEGVIVRGVEMRDRTTLLYVQPYALDDRYVDTIVQVSTTLRRDLMYGDVVRVSGELARPSSFGTETLRTFHYPEYLRAQGVTHTIAFADVVMVKSTYGPFLLRPIFILKSRFLSGLERMLVEPQSGLASGLVLGEKKALGPEVESWFRISGIIHIVVLSGYNLTIVADAVMRALSFFCSLRTRLVLAAGSVISFALIVGLSATVLRASIMALLVLLAHATGKTYVAFRALLVAFFLMLMINPYVLVFDPGFQFSFLATLGLIFLAPTIREYLSYVSTWGGFREYIASTIGAQLMVTPLLLFSIGTFSIVALITNSLVLIVVPLAMLCVFITGIVGMLFGGAFIVFAYPTHFVLSYILFVAHTMTLIPFATVTLPPFSFAYVLLLYGVGGFLWWYVVYKKTPHNTPQSHVS